MLTRAARRRVPYKMRKICRNSLVIIATLDKNGRSPLCESLDSNHYSRMSPLWECLDSNIGPSKSISRSRRTIFTITPFVGKCQNLHTSIFLIFAKVWPVLMKVADTHTHRHTQTYKPIAIGEVWLIFQTRYLCRSISNNNPHKNHRELFCASSYRLRKINIFNFLPWKCRSRSQRIKNGLTTFDRINLNVYWWFFFTTSAVRQHTKRIGFYIF